MKRKRIYLIIMRNGDSVRRFYKSTSVVLTQCFDSVMWLQANDKRVSKFMDQGYWVDSIY